MLRRLTAARAIEPVIDRPRAEEALREHFRRLGLTAPPIEWHEDAVQAFVACTRISSDSKVEWNPGKASAWAAARAILWAAGEHQMNVNKESKSFAPPAFAAIEEKLWSASWTSNDSTASGTSIARAHAIIEKMAASDAKRIRKSPVTMKDGVFEVSSANDKNKNYEEQQNDLKVSKINHAAQWKKIWEPFVDAYEAGLWTYIVFADRIVCIPRPKIMTDTQNGRLHCPDGPAISWENGCEESKMYYWKGIEIQPFIVEEPEKITVKMIESERNTEIRRVMTEKYGTGRYIMDSGAKEMQRDDWGILYRKEVLNDEAIVMVKVVNSTPEPDGSYKDYFLRVPPTTRTARGGIAWTFEKEESNYSPVKQT